MNQPAPSVAVLTSGGLDSAVLVAEMTRRDATVWPLYIEAGLRWEPTEIHYLQRYLELIARPNLKPLVVLQMPVGDLYQQHWSLTGRGVPDSDSPDAAVYMPGRNLFLLTKALVWCHLHHAPSLALGILQGNPFPDATPRFFDLVERTVQEAVGHRMQIERPFAQMHKTDVVKMGRDLPLQWSFSCIQPTNDRHCGRCNKCAERRKAFAEAKVSDPTTYGASDVPSNA